jgi:hypothetical protein
MIVLAIMMVAMSMFAHTMTSASRLDPVANETAIAAEAARTTLEHMRSVPFLQRFTRYNADPSDDPDGTGTAPGNHFNVPGLTPLAVNGFVGEITFPSRGAEIREDVADATLGMPRDLNGDGVVDSLDHTHDCVLLPVRVRLQWVSQTGKANTRTFTMYTMFANQ